MPTPDEFAFLDFDRLERALIDLGKAGLRFLRERYPNERFYVFGFLTHPLRTGPVPIANSEEALQRVAEVRVGDDSYPEIDSARKELRWEASEWPYDTLLYDAFQSNSAWEFDRPLTSFLDSLHDAGDKEDDKAFDRLYRCIDEAYYRALNHLRRDDLLGQIAAGNEVLFNLFQFDQSDHERLKHAKQVNPPALFARYKDALIPPELQALQELYQRLGARSWSDLAGMHYKGDSSILARTIFAREAVRLTVQKDDPTCFEEANRLLYDSRPELQEFGRTVGKMLNAGISHQEINLVVRQMQYHAICALCQLLDYPATDVPEGQGVRWRLFQVDEENKPIALLEHLTTNMYDLFESVSKERASKESLPPMAATPIDLTGERDVNQAAFWQLKPYIDKAYPPGHFVAIDQGEIVGDAATFDELHQQLLEAGMDAREILVVQAGGYYPKYVQFLGISLMTAAARQEPQG